MTKKKVDEFAEKMKAHKTLKLLDGSWEHFADHDERFTITDDPVLINGPDNRTVLQKLLNRPVPRIPDLCPLCKNPLVFLNRQTRIVIRGGDGHLYFRESLKRKHAANYCTHCGYRYEYGEYHEWWSD